MWAVGGKLQREGTYGYLCLIHVDVGQRPTLYCKAIILQLKRNKKRNVPLIYGVDGVLINQLVFFTGWSLPLGTLNSRQLQGFANGIQASPRAEKQRRNTGGGRRSVRAETVHCRCRGAQRRLGSRVNTTHGREFDLVRKIKESFTKHWR